MLKNVDEIIEGFYAALASSGISDKSVRIVHRTTPPPHENCVLPKGECAVYIFSLTDSHGSNCSAGKNRVIKVGKVGPNSNPRFQYQHYKPKSAQSTVAGKLLACPILWDYLGIVGLNDSNVEGWLKMNTDRDHFFINGDQLAIRDVLEVYLKGLLGPVFEG